MTQPNPYDILIVGGGINGAGIARDAAGRGLRVLLIEQGDLASATSSASSKLVHGGLRYLEYYEFKLVREALRERERLLTIAPHIIWPLTFVLPHIHDMRPAWMMQAGLLMYDNLAPRQKLAKSQRVDLTRQTSFAGPLKPELTTAFTYADCWVDDARLVVLNAVDAHAHGAEIRTRTRCVALEQKENLWHATLEARDGTQQTVAAKAVVNAAGPWANEVAGLSGVAHKGRIKRVKGSHIVVPRLHEGDQAYILQMPDKRIIFLLPFEDEYTLIGTTDIASDDDPAQAAITQDEIAYLLKGANRYLAKPISADDMVWSYAGVRSLYDDANTSVSAMTRDYVLELRNADGGKPPLLSVFGGKLTTYRTLAEHAMAKLLPFFPTATCTNWTDQSALPGGEESVTADGIRQRYPFVPEEVAVRWCRQYGSRIHTLLKGITDADGLGAEVAPGVFTCELTYVRQHEWVQKGSDFLWRRTKLGLRLDDAQTKSVSDWFAKQT